MKHRQGPLNWNSNHSPLNGCPQSPWKHRVRQYLSPMSRWSFRCMISKVLFSFYRGKLNAHYCKLFLQYHLCCAVREKQPELVKNAINLHDMLQCTQQTLLRMFSGSGDEKCYKTFPVLPGSFHVTMIWFPHWSSHCMGNALQIERTF
jgi:hypothetical protein